MGILENMAAGLIVVIGIMFLSAYLYSRLFGAEIKGERDFIRVITNVPLGPKKSIAVVNIAGKHMALGITENSITHLADIENIEGVEVVKKGDDDNERGRIRWSGLMGRIVKMKYSSFKGMKFFPPIIFFSMFALFSPSVSFGAGEGLNLPDVSLRIGGGNDLSGTIQILTLLTVLTILPAIILMMTSFTRFIIVFSLLRQALSLQQTPPNQVLIGLSLFMTFFVMSPVFEKSYATALEPYLSKKMSQQEAFSAGIKPFREFMLKQTKEKELALFVEMSKMQKPAGYDDIPTSVIIPAFIISELKIAFQIGFILFIPFLIIDMVVASILMAMGMLMLPPIMISLPFKLMLFVLVDGWSLLVGSMIGSFRI
ncbi:MAG: flagellar type III secretion system pore protein FliP [Deltaproteobacteria bacterium]|nr:flagellar type III secretion system pore protein FliP [Deltaproteobacteria bacterium]